MASSASGTVAPGAVGSVVPWFVPIARAVPAIAAAIATTFTGGHSAQFGLVLLASWAAATAVADVLAWRMLPAGTARSSALGRAVVGLLAALLAGLTALGALGAFDEITRTAALALTAAAMLILLGMLDAIVGVKTKGLDAFSRDWMTAGVIQVVAAILILFVSPALEHRFEVEGAQGVLTGAIMVIGLLGLTAAVLGVLLTIAGVSLRGRRAAASAQEEAQQQAEAAADATETDDEFADAADDDAPVAPAAGDDEKDATP